MEVPKKIGPYTVYGSLGSGGYGQVVAARDNKTLQSYAIKISTDYKSLQKEYKILKSLQKHEEFMKVYEYGSLDSFQYMVMDLFGKNLQYKSNEYILSIKTVAAIGLEILNQIEIMHNLDIIHRDIKPSQFLLDHDQRKVFLVDFGISTFFRVGGKHKPFKSKLMFKGSVVYSSINSHLGFKLSRRDDLESLAYSLLYLIRGELPWKVTEGSESRKYMRLILNQKLNIKRDLLFKDVPAEFEAFFLYTRKLLYDQTPNYGYLKSLLSKFVQVTPIYLNFDWNDNPEFFSKFESKVTTVNQLSTLYFKNCNGEFMSKRRNGQMDLNEYRRLSKSFDVSQLEELKNLDSHYNTLKQLKEQRKRMRSKSTKHKKTVVQKISSVNDTLGLPSMANSLELSPIELSPTSVSQQVSKKSSFVIDETYNRECETSRNDLPEFIDRKKILDSRNDFCQEHSKKSSLTKCLTF